MHHFASWWELPKLLRSVNRLTDGQTNWIVDKWNTFSTFEKHKQNFLQWLFNDQCGKKGTSRTTKMGGKFFQLLFFLNIGFGQPISTFLNG